MDKSLLTLARVRTVPSFLDWINNNLAIYAHPAKTPLKDIWWIGFDLIINVSDHIDHKLHAKIADQGVPVYWFPMGESFGMPLENIFGAVSVLWHAEANNHRVFLHSNLRIQRATLNPCELFMYSQDILEIKHKPI